MKRSTFFKSIAAFLMIPFMKKAKATQKSHYPSPQVVAPGLYKNFAPETIATIHFSNPEYVEVQCLADAHNINIGVPSVRVNEFIIIPVIKKGEVYYFKFEHFPVRGWKMVAKKWYER